MRTCRGLLFGLSARKARHALVRAKAGAVALPTPLEALVIAGALLSVRIAVLIYP